jgi:hypothetical protein
VSSLVLATGVVGVAILVSAGLACLVHELGHAFCYTRLSGRRAVVYVGQRPGLIMWRLKGMDVHFDPRVGDPRRGRPECLIDPRGLTASQLRQVIWGGPVATGLLGLGLLAVAVSAIRTPTDWVFLASATACFVCFAFVVEDMIPGRGKDGSLSDGGKLKLLTGFEPDAVPVSPDAAPAAPWQSVR